MDKKIIVNKFGGGILKKDFIPLIQKRLKDQIKAGYRPVVVVSALPGTTDELLNFVKKAYLYKNNYSEILNTFLKGLSQKHNQVMLDINLDKDYQEKVQTELNKIFINLEKDLIKVFSVNLTNEIEDKIISYGERLSAVIFTNYLTSVGLPAKKTLAEEIPIITDDNFKNANIIFDISEKNTQKVFSSLNEIMVVPGFTGITQKGKITTLGRGGTDTTACFIGSALRAVKIILWKDVGGVLSADPKIVPQAKTIPFISYQEAEEAGKIIHDKAIQYTKLYKTEIEITSLADPKLTTKIGPSKTLKKGTKIVSYKKDLTLFLITDEIIKGSELLSIVSNAFAKNKVDVILISNTRYSLQIVADNNNASSQEVLEELKKKVYQVETHPVSMVFLVGNFDVQYVNDFNSLLVKSKVDLEISAFLYKNCTRLEAVIKTDKIENIIKTLYKKFIK